MTSKQTSLVQRSLHAIGRLVLYFAPHRRRTLRFALTFSALLVSILSLTSLVFLDFSVLPLYAQEPFVEPAFYPALVPLANIKAITASGRHTCVLTIGGGVKCWGLDDQGQVGDGVENSNKTTPVDVVGLGSGVQAIAAGGNHTCALTTSGGVKCWGSDTDGQLGDGANNDSKSAPVDVVGLGSGVQAIAVGGAHTCALTTGGGVKCWGNDFYGGLGDGANNDDKLEPVNVVGLDSGVQAIAAGGAHTCALMTGGGVKCWGLDSSGQAGDGVENSNKLTPVDVLGLSGAQAIVAGGQFTCALTTGGGVKCWGNDSDGQIGNGADTSNKPAPVDVGGLGSGVQAIAAGGAHACALTSGGGVKCWGFDFFGQIGDGPENSDKPVPVDVTGLGSGMQAIAAGEGHTCALTTGGGVKCWGFDQSGQVGDGAYNGDKQTPVDVVVPATCFKLTLKQNGSGALPLVTSGASDCQPEHYLRGATILLLAAPAANQRVQVWSAPVAGSAGNQQAALVMPNNDITVTVTYAPCFALTRAHTGAGGDPVASPTSSAGCVAGRYAAGEPIGLTAQPNANQHVQGWSAQATGAVGSLSGAITMPNAATTVTVTYAPCFALTRAHSGAGGDPVASPVSSAGCVAARYAQGESIVLTALPNANQRVKSWSGATGTPAVGSQVNSVTMPGSDKSVSVAYEACFALATNKSGEGDVPIAAPDVSSGCLTGGFAAGESIALLAKPAAGWRVARWSGTSNDASTSASNFVVMPESGASVAVVYEPVAVEVENLLFLPTISR